MASVTSFLLKQSGGGMRLVVTWTEGAEQALNAPTGPIVGQQQAQAQMPLQAIAQQQAGGSAQGEAAEDGSGSEGEAEEGPPVAS